MLDGAWLLHTRTHSNCCYLHQIKPTKNSSREQGGAPVTPILAQGLLTGDDCGEGSHFSLEIATSGLPMPQWVTP